MEEQVNINDKILSLRVKSPDGKSTVDFNNLTLRQLQVLEEYKRLYEIGNIVFDDGEGDEVWE